MQLVLVSDGEYLRDDLSSLSFDQFASPPFICSILKPVGDALRLFSVRGLGGLLGSAPVRQGEAGKPVRLPRESAQ